MPAKGRCEHKDRKKVSARIWHCSDCGNDFTPRNSPVSHGTVEGFNKHNRVRRGNWSAPPCQLCVDGRTEWRREYDNRPTSVQARRFRTAARAAALETLRRQYPRAYSAAYREQVEIRGGQVVRQQYEVPEWESILSKMVMALTGLSEEEAEERSRSISRVPLEQREVMTQIRRLRVLLAARFPTDKRGPANVHGRKAP